MKLSHKLVECVPNISEGRDQAKIEAIADEVRRTPDVILFDIDPDPDHNRTVITFVGAPERVVEAVLRLTAKAIELIDLNKHKGEHPRMGAVDVIPFVPIKHITMQECVELSKQVAQKLWERFRIPVYLYEESATRPERKDLANIRKGEFENFSNKIKEAEWAPDFGERKIHPTAGVVAMGARMPLIAFNVNLGTNNLEIAKKIAKAVRHSNGGLRYVKALAFELKERGIVQISMNMTNFKKTPLHQAFELIKREAERYGVPIIGSEIVGLVPQEALNQAAEYYLQLENFRPEMILEERIAQAMVQVPLSESSS